MALRNPLSLRQGLLWLSLNLALIIQCLSRNNIFFVQFYVPRMMSSPTHCGERTPG
jgi:hypothetical protein